MLYVLRRTRARRDYTTPRYTEVDVGRDCCKIKLIANLYHSHCLVIHLVHAHIPDDSNLMLHCLDTSLEVLIFSSNNFTGGIPVEWGLLTNLKELRMVKCGLDGA